LTAVLQKLYDNNQLLSLFTNHEYSATALNEIKSRANSEGVTAIAVAGREFEIVDGVVSLIVKEVITPEPEIIVEPQVIEEVITPEPEIITEETSDITA
jgi:hypothetical protein